MQTTRRGSAAADEPITIRRTTAAETAAALSRLPTEVAEKLEAMLLREADAGVLVQDLAQQRAHASNRKAQAESYLDRTHDAPVNPARAELRETTWFGNAKRHAARTTEHVDIERGRLDAQQADAARAVEEAKAECARIDARIASLQAQRSRLPATLVAWINSQPGQGVLPLYSGPQQPPEALTPAEVERLRESIEDLRAEIDAVRAAPLPASDAKARMRAQLANLAAAGAPNCLGLVESGYPVRLAEVQIQSQTAAGLAFHRQPDAIGLLAWLFGDQIAAKLENEIDALADPVNALSTDEKITRVGELKALILETERQEEAIIEYLETTGYPIPRRDKADPRAVLGLSSELSEPKRNAF